LKLKFDECRLYAVCRAILFLLRHYLLFVRLMGSAASRSYRRSPLTVLGRGGFSIVRKVVTDQGKILAVKEMDVTSLKSVDPLITELTILKAVGEEHPFIVSLNSSFMHTRFCCFVFDAHLGGDLSLHLRNKVIFTETCVAYYMAAIGSALHYLHRLNILHRDVKPHNIVLDSRGVPRLTDFGVSYATPDLSGLAICNLTSGTLPYMAPETLTPTHYHSYQADFWSLGVLAYELLFSQRPFPVHCPKRYVSLASKEYALLWERALESEVIDPALYDWVEAHNAIRDEINPCLSDTLPFERNCNHHPDYWKVPVPAWSSSDRRVSPECIFFLSGLLDVRIHLRLGSPHSFDSFSNHSWLRTNKVDGFDTKKRITLPVPSFTPNLQVVEDILIHELGFATPVESDILSHRICPDDVERLRNCFHYTSPSRAKELSAQPTIMSSIVAV
jgi:serine/threonine protein kinase